MNRAFSARLFFIGANPGRRFALPWAGMNDAFGVQLHLSAFSHPKRAVPFVRPGPKEFSHLLPGFRYRIADLFKEWEW
jgi:hypothetical protein